jgi:hypothetical protein
MNRNKRKNQRKKLKEIKICDDHPVKIPHSSRKFVKKNTFITSQRESKKIDTQSIKTKATMM